MLSFSAARLAGMIAPSSPPNRQRRLPSAIPRRVAAAVMFAPETVTIVPPAEGPRLGVTAYTYIQVEVRSKISGHGV